MVVCLNEGGECEVMFDCCLVVIGVSLVVLLILGLKELFYWIFIEVFVSDIIFVCLVVIGLLVVVLELV